MKTTLVVIVAFAALTQLIQGHSLLRRKRDLSAEEYEETMNYFTQRFLTEVWHDEGDNFVFSPFNLHTALSILTSGATDNTQTQRELLDALGSVQVIERLENHYKQVFENYLEPDVQNTLTFGNTLWKRDQIIKEAFKKKLNETYKAEILPIGTAKDINDWVKKVTKGKIDKIIDSITTDTRLLIVNALYMNAAWTVKFEDIEEPQAFTLQTGEQAMIDMMVRRESYHNVYSRFQFRGQDYTTVSIPYQPPNDRIAKASSRFEMVIIMPDHHGELARLQHHLSRNKENVDINIFDAAQTALLDQPPTKLTLHMPRFTIDSGVVPLKKYFKKMGISAPFDQEGGFKKIVDEEDLIVNRILHRATVEVTKEGTIGAAATAIELVAISADFTPSEEVIINKPFIFYVRDKAEKAILFAGKFLTPPTTK